MRSYISRNKLALSGEGDVHYDLALRLKGKKPQTEPGVLVPIQREVALPCEPKCERESVCEYVCVAHHSQLEKGSELQKVALCTSDVREKRENTTK